MKVRIVCYEDLDLWILGKFARKMQIELSALGVDCDIGKVPDPLADINHHIIYFYYDGRPSTIDTVMVTHIDEAWKLEQVRKQLTAVPMGICMSATTVQQLVDGGIPRERLSYVLPAHDQVMRPRPLAIGITSKIHSDGRKRELLLVALADQLDPRQFFFKIMGAGWHGIVDQLRARGFTVEYHDAFDYELNQRLVPTFDYYLYLGLDEGAMGFIDALAAGVPTIATPQGYHLEAVNGITHPFVTLEELRSVFRQIAKERAVLTDSVAGWNWREYAIRHLEIWQYLRYGQARHLSPVQRPDGIGSVALPSGQSCVPWTDDQDSGYTIARKKVLIVCSHFWPSSGGLESRMGQFSGELVAAGYYTVVMTQAMPNRSADVLNGVRILSVAPDQFSATIRKTVASGDYDAAILIQDPLGNIIWSLEGLAPPPTTRVLIQPIINEDGYGKWKEHPTFRAGLTSILKAAAVPLVMTRSGPDIRYMREAGLPAVYLPNATRQSEPAGDFRARYGIAPDRFLIVHIANLFWVKNHIGLMDALSDMPPNWQLVMIGNESGEPACVEAVRGKLAGRPDILFIPGLPKEWVASAIQSADVVVLASMGEGSPITILEAMSHGRPWLATPQCGAANDHLGGFICELDEFKPYLAALAASPALRQTLGSISYSHWEQCYAWPVAMQGWIELIEDGKLQREFGPGTELVAHMDQARKTLLNQPALKALEPERPARWPLVSVVIPTYNRPDMLARALGSVMRQDYPRLEVLVINDAGLPIEDTVALHNALGNVQAINMPENGGAARARNAGLRAAKGHFIAFLDDDDEYLPQHVSTLVNTLLNSSARFAYSRAEYLMEAPGASGTQVTRQQPFANVAYSRGLLEVGNFIPTPTWFFARSLLAEAGYFDETFKAWEDWEWLIRVSAATDFLSVPQITVEVHQRADDASHLGVQHRPQMRQWFERVYEKHPPSSTEVAQQRAAYLHSLFPPAGAPADPSNALGNLDGVQLGSKDIVSIINIAEQQMQSGAWELAAQTYSTWLQHSQSPLRYVAAYNLGSLWSGKGRPDLAVSFFAQSLQLNPVFVPGHFALALHLERVGQAAAAQPHYLWLADAANGVEASHRDIYQTALLKTGATQTPA